VEVEEMIHKLREEQGRPFDVRQLTTSCVANVIMNMLFGHRFDHSDLAFQQIISDISERASSFSLVFEIFPLLRMLPYFKTNLDKHLARAKKIFSFLSRNITTSIEVCNFGFFYGDFGPGNGSPQWPQTLFLCLLLGLFCCYRIFDSLRLCRLFLKLPRRIFDLGSN